MALIIRYLLSILLLAWTVCTASKKGFIVPKVVPVSLYDTLIGAGSFRDLEGYPLGMVFSTENLAVVNSAKRAEYGLFV